MKIPPPRRACPEAVNNNVRTTITATTTILTPFRSPHLFATPSMCVGQANMQQLGPWLANTKKHSHPEIQHTCARPLDGIASHTHSIGFRRDVPVATLLQYSMHEQSIPRSLVYPTYRTQPWKPSEPNPVFSSAASRSPNKRKQPEQAQELLLETLACLPSRDQLPSFPHCFG